MTQRIPTRPLTPAAFARFGDVLDAAGTPDKLINQGRCGRFHDRAQLDFCDGRAGLSIFSAQKETLPYRLQMMERHPLGSQAFMPMTEHAFLVTVAEDDGGKPGVPVAFLTEAGQGINLRRGVWHGVLTPLAEPGLFAVIDRIGDGTNLQEHWFETEYLIV